MTVGFYHAAPKHTEHITCAAQLMASVRQVMPGVSVVQFTTADSVQVPGVDRCVVRPSAPVALGTLAAYASVDGEWLFVDTDVIVQRDVRHVFDQPFDLAVATRAGTFTKRDLQTGRTFMQRMSFNKGAVFSRSPQFWRACIAETARYSTVLRTWMGDQQAMNDVIAAGQFTVAVLPNGYNYPPKRRSEDVSDKHILHFKGARKAWLLGRAA